MATVKLSRHIAAELDRVFDTASDFAAAPQAIASVKHVELLTDGPVGLGTRFRETRVVMNQEATEELEVIAFDRPRSFEVGAEVHGCRIRSAMTFEANGDGTDVEFSFDATPVSVAAKAMASMMEPMLNMLAQECGRDLDDLKKAIEAQ